MIIVDDYVIQRNSRADTVSPNHGVKPCNHQGRTVSSQGNLDKSS